MVTLIKWYDGDSILHEPQAAHLSGLFAGIGIGLGVEVEGVVDHKGKRMGLALSGTPEKLRKVIRPLMTAFEGDAIYEVRASTDEEGNAITEAIRQEAEAYCQEHDEDGSVLVIADPGRNQGGH
jgi:hypothetical protein